MPSKERKEDTRLDLVKVLGICNADCDRGCKSVLSSSGIFWVLMDMDLEPFQLSSIPSPMDQDPSAYLYLEDDASAAASSRLALALFVNFMPRAIDSSLS